MLDVRETPVEPLLGGTKILVVLGNVNKILLTEVAFSVFA
jgi:hypothetical protein